MRTKIEKTATAVSSAGLVRPRLKRGEYWVFALVDITGKMIGCSSGGITDKRFIVPEKVSMAGRNGLFESAEHGVVIYREPNAQPSNAAESAANQGDK